MAEHDKFIAETFGKIKTSTDVESGTVYFLNHRNSIVMPVKSVDDTIICDCGERVKNMFIGKAAEENKAYFCHKCGVTTEKKMGTLVCEHRVAHATYEGIEP
jgi:hypothetical protein